MSKANKTFLPILILTLLIFLSISSKSLAMLDQSHLSKPFINGNKGHQKQSFLHGPWKAISYALEKIINVSNNQQIKKKYRHSFRKHTSSHKHSSQSSSSALVKRTAFFTLPIIVVIVGAIASSLYNIYYNSDLFNEENDENKVDPDRKYRDALLDEFKGEEDPTDGRLIFPDYEEELKEKYSEEEWEKRLKKDWGELNRYIDDISKYDAPTESEFEKMPSMYAHERDLYDDDYDIDIHKAGSWKLNTGITELATSEEQSGKTSEESSDGNAEDTITIKSTQQLIELYKSGEKSLKILLSSEHLKNDPKKMLLERYLSSLLKEDRVKKLGIFALYDEIKKEELSEALKKNSSLQSITFSRDLSAETKMFMDALNESPLSLQNLEIDIGGKESLFALKRVLKENKNLVDLRINLDLSAEIFDRKLFDITTTIFANDLKENTNLKNLEFNYYIEDEGLCDYEDEEYKDIGKHIGELFKTVLKTNDTLEKLSINSNKKRGHTLDDPRSVGALGDDGTALIAKGLEKNTSLRILNLPDNLVGDDGAKNLGKALKQNSSLMKLSLSNNQIGSDGATKLSKGLKENTTLRELNIDSNENIGSRGAYHLAKMLKENRGLKNFSFVSWHVGPEEAIKLIKAIKENGSLEVFRMSLDNPSLENQSTKTKEKLWAKFSELLIENTNLKEILFLARIRDDNLNKVIEAVNRSPSLRGLDLNAKKLTEQGVIAALEKLKRNTALKKLVFHFSEDHNINDERMSTATKNLLKENHFLTDLFFDKGKYWDWEWKFLHYPNHLMDEAKEFLHINRFIEKYFPTEDVGGRKILKELICELLDNWQKPMQDIDERAMLTQVKLLIKILQIEEYEVKNYRDSIKLRKIIKKAGALFKEAVNNKSCPDQNIVFLSRKMYHSLQLKALDHHDSDDELAKELRKMSILYIAFSYGLCPENNDYFEDTKKLFVDSLIENIPGSSGTGGLLSGEYLDNKEKNKELAEGFLDIIFERRQRGPTIFDTGRGRRLPTQIIFTLFKSEEIEDIRNFSAKYINVQIDHLLKNKENILEKIKNLKEKFASFKKSTQDTSENENDKYDYDKALERYELAIALLKTDIQFIDEKIVRRKLEIKKEIDDALSMSNDYNALKKISDLKKFFTNITETAGLPNDVKKTVEELLELANKIQTYLEQEETRSERSDEIEDEPDKKPTRCLLNLCNLM